MTARKRRGVSPVRLLHRVAPPLLLFLALLAAWVAYVRLAEVPHYILPSPWRIGQALVEDWALLSAAFVETMKITFLALALAVMGSVGLAVLFSQSRLVERTLYPFAVILQVTPVVAVAPLLLIYTPTTQVALLVCAFLVAFFPLLSNTVQGLKSVDPHLADLFALYGATRRQRLALLLAPSALPYFLTGLRISGGLALIAAVVAEFAGSAGARAGLAFRILEAQYRLNIPRLFAALFLIAVAGVLIFLATSAVSHLLLRRWHDSARPRE